MTKSEVDHTGLDREEAMSGLAGIQQAISVLPEAKYAQLREWFSDLDWEKWDQQVEADAHEGRLDVLIAEALDAKEAGALQEL